MIFLLLLIPGRRRRRRQRSRAAGVVQATSRPRGSSDADTAVWVWLLAAGLSSPRGTCLAACCRGSGTCTTRGEGECAAKEESEMYVTAAKRSSAYVVLLLPFAALSRRLRPPRLCAGGRVAATPQRNVPDYRCLSVACRRRAIALPCPGCGRASRSYLVWITQELSLTTHVRVPSGSCSPGAWDRASCRVTESLAFDHF